MGFSYIGCGISLHGFPGKAKPLLLTLYEFTPPDLECGVAPLGPPAPAQPLLLGTMFKKKKIVKKKKKKKRKKKKSFVNLTGRILSKKVL